MSAPWIALIVVLTITVVLLAVIVLGLLRRVSGVLEAAEFRLRDAGLGGSVGGAAVGTKVGAFSVVDREGATIPSAHLLQRGAVLVFVEAACEPCQHLAASLRSGATIGASSPVYAIAPVEERSHDWDLGTEVVVVFQRERAVSEVFDNIATPQAFAVNAEGIVVDRSIVNSAARLRELSEQTVGTQPLDASR